MITILNLDLLLVGTAVAGAAMLGISVFVSNARSATAQALLAYSLVTIGWSLANYASYRLPEPEQVLTAIRLVLFFASWHALTFLLLALNFPANNSRIRRVTVLLLLSWTAAISLLTLTPFVYQAVESITPTIQTAVGPGIALFGLTVVSFIVTGIFILARRLRTATQEKRQYELVFSGVVITFAFVVIFNFLFPAFLNSAELIPYGGLFQLPLIMLTAYAILKHKLFNVKVAGSALIVFALALVSVGEIILAHNTTTIIFRSVVFTFVLILGGFLIRSVYREVEQRELIDEQRRELAAANAQQESLLHFISHEIKGYLTKNEAAFDAIRSGDFGETSPQLHDLSTTALADTRKGVSTVMDILDASNLKKGTVAYKKEPFDLSQSIQLVVNDLTSAAREKGLLLSYKKPSQEIAPYTGDADKLARHVFRNIIDNSIKYTVSGSVQVLLTKSESGYRFVVSDTGVGITPDDMSRLFTEGGHGKDSIKVNVHSTGYGLYIAKQIVEAHGGKVWAESDGAGKGSRFVVELPTS